MKHLRDLSSAAATGLALLASTPKGSAEDELKVAAAQRGAWETAAPELGHQDIVALAVRHRVPGCARADEMIE